MEENWRENCVAVLSEEKWKREEGGCCKSRCDERSKRRLMTELVVFVKRSIAMHTQDVDFAFCSRLVKFFH